MASCSVLTEDQFSCAICFGVLTDPATIPCGHTFCMACLQGYWASIERPPVCALCKRGFTSGLDIQVNITLRDLVETFKGMNGGVAAHRLPAAPGEVSCDVCLGERQDKAVKTCLVCLSSYCQNHIRAHNARFSRHQLVSPLANLGERICPTHERLLERYCRTDRTMLCVACDAHQEPGHEVVTMQREFLSQKAQLTKDQVLVQERLKAAQKKAETLSSSAQRCKDEAERQIQSWTMFCKDRFYHERQIWEHYNAEARKTLSEMESTASRESRALAEGIATLKGRAAELERVIDSSDSFELLKSLPSLPPGPPSGDRVPCTVFTTNLLADVWMASLEEMAILPKMHTFWLTNSGFSELAAVKEFTVEVTPDPSTAHPSLLFRRGCREIRVDRTKMDYTYPKSAQRFTQVPCVLSTKGFTSQSAYWEVELSDRARNGSSVWCVGLAVQSSMITISRWHSLTPDKGFWVLEHRDGKLWPVTTPPTTTALSIKSSTCKVHLGVFFDGRQRRLSFYDVPLGRHLYTYDISAPMLINQVVYPVFSPDLFSPGLNQINIMNVTALTAKKHRCH
ncbi:E3 ubiquitin-protein ligase TRIM39 [Esox lucius]|uniref:Uncharacterized protein n=1 Tax=Esox lucius TaxID=8010 RepID=A0A3P8XSV4_ESOLU|nr:E3 ubiquitin-protein ligase TRIM39 [Esox lucius]XP_010862813.2 E3 ubiquitin-protein ligase TRIM39 [Esox lucius]